ncbi:pseudouridine synthase [Streptomyces sp. CWNU-52B]|uniref:pseudouridine synthase n=1 Tax=unclassified Streptomyces TaxID=2593676 RepID=UPI0039C05A60
MRSSSSSSGSGSRNSGGRGNPRGTGGSGGSRGSGGGGGNPRGSGGGGGNPRGAGGGGGGSRGSGGGGPRGSGSAGPRTSGSGFNSRGTAGSGSQQNGAQGPDDRPKRPSKPRPEERRYDVGPGATHEGAKSGRGPSARGGAKGGPKQSQQRGGRTENARSREYETRTEERNRDRYAGRPEVKTPKTFPGAEQEGERLQKVLARAGYGSRRACEELVEQSRVEVNGEIVVEQGMRVDPEHDEIRVDGLTVATQSYQFFVLNKPAGVVSTMEDNEGRQCLGDYVTNRETRLFHVGRLDTETEGIILLTNHGELAHRLTHPKYGVKKVYLAHIVGPIPRDLGKQLKDGIQLEDGYAKADHFRVVEQTGKNYMVEVTLHEGRKHIVRRMLAEAGYPVDKLVRVSFGPIALGDQKSGWLRRLSNTEVGMLMQEVGL